MADLVSSMVAGVKKYRSWLDKRTKEAQRKKRMNEQTEKAKAVLRREYGTDKVTETLAEKEERMKKKQETYSDEGKKTRGSILNRSEKLRQAME